MLRAAVANPAPTIGYHVGEYRYLLAWSYQLAGDAAAARAEYEAARDAMEILLKAQPDTPELFMYLGLTYAGLGDRPAALRAAEATIALRPASSDHSTGPGFEENRARVHAQLGDADAAISEIAQLLTTNYLGPERVILTPASLRLDPIWDPIRADPRFRALSQTH